jgi:hypothetical protein
MIVGDSIHQYFSRLGQRAGHPVSTGAYRVLVWRDDRIDWLINERDFHFLPVTEHATCSCAHDLGGKGLTAQFTTYEEPDQEAAWLELAFSFGTSVK